MHLQGGLLRPKLTVHFKIPPFPKKNSRRPRHSTIFAAVNFRWKIAQYFEAWWWRFYLSRRPLPEYLQWKVQYWQRFLEQQQIAIADGARILDAGCGPAGIFMVFKKQQVCAVDPLLDKYRQPLGPLDEEHFPNTEFVQAALENFQPPTAFDAIFCLNAINHVSDMDVCLGNLHGALAPDGHLFISVDAHNHLWLKKIFRLLPGDILHPHQLDLTGYMEKLEQAGFETQQTSLLKNHFIFNYYLLRCKRKTAR
jgi:2-polyprenyl-6-hydroxyphenyl methylase/3-demethylubiquinone-9 3-methyltransferase